MREGVRGETGVGKGRGSGARKGGSERRASEEE